MGSKIRNTFCCHYFFPFASLISITTREGEREGWYFRECVYIYINKGGRFGCEPVKAIFGGLFEGGCSSDEGRHPRGLKVESNLEIRFRVHHCVFWRFDRVARDQYEVKVHCYYQVIIILEKVERWVSHLDRLLFVILCLYWKRISSAFYSQDKYCPKFALYFFSTTKKYRSAADASADAIACYLHVPLH